MWSEASEDFSSVYPTPARQATSVETNESPAMVAIASLVFADSPRLWGEEENHIRALAESEADLPPILIHRPTMMVIDGTHRARAAQMRGEENVPARFFDGDASMAFVLAVQANISHGLPLSRSDREAAVVRIIKSYPDWSDRAIAAVTGLSARTVAVIRHRDPTDVQEPQARVGRDGKVRPLSAAKARERASEVISARPEASLREIAKTVGLSIATVRDVRCRLQRGEDPVPSRQRQSNDEHECQVRTGERPRGGGPGDMSRGASGVADFDKAAGRRRTWTHRDHASILQGLRNDPSLRFTEHGRTLLRWLTTLSGDFEAGRNLLDEIPAHTRYLIADFARICAQQWVDVAVAVERATGEATEQAS